MRPVLQEPVRVDRVEIAIAGLPPTLEGLKLAQLSDFHYDGERLADKILIDAIAAVNAAAVDLILLTGDYITDSPKPIHQLVQHLQQLESRYGIYACLGNHDIYFPNSRKPVVNALTSVGINVLWNEIAYPMGSELAIAGLADFWSGQFQPAPVLNQIDPQTPRIVLSHNPDTAALLQKWRVDLQLSGHTHGGQIMLPGRISLPLLLQNWSPWLPKSIQGLIPMAKKCKAVVQHWEWGQGWHQIGDNQLYVNRGLGSYFPGRFGCPPEVTVMTLKTA
ncbi:MAG: metallophosphoesterase [Jaaginema sp. PMC 1079.18]|nr:metallophosphoesterase [Jaaginema sp. PMC 1080.18]MEC4853934.1 metallophosphoesterase [Jaaginema sp. PMC 1079.18]MEC4869153.1 metallophosphoesterase [Jaaginema sp. PMC 1078.18]